MNIIVTKRGYICKCDDTINHIQYCMGWYFDE